MFYIALALIIYMPLHVFIVQSASLLTGGLDAWKAAKDIFLVGLAPLLLYLTHAQGLFKDKTFRALLYVGGAYGLIHLLFVLFDGSDDTYSAIVGSVYNVRLLGFLLIGYVVGRANNAKEYLKHLLTATVLIASAVALFGVLQYFLPHNLLENVGYTLDRGVKPLFFIDDNPDLPRVMSTLKDPNSLGSYLILPILISGYALVSKKVNGQLFMRPFRKPVLTTMLMVMTLALFLTFSRGALLGLVISVTTLVLLNNQKKVRSHIKKYWWAPLAIVLVVGGLALSFRESEFVQDYVLHASETTNQADPNEKRLTLGREAVDRVVGEPLGHGPGSAGLVSINNPKGGFLTENYYLQIVYEVGWLGLALFLVILYLVVRKLHNSNPQSPISNLLLASLAGYLFYSFFIHLWSNEAVALQWWLLASATIALSPKTKRS